MSKKSLDQIAKPHGVQVEHPSEHEEHIVSPMSYLGVFALLLVFTGITTAIAFKNLGVFNPIVALTIATIKAVAVILIFMHVKYSPKTTALTVISAAFFLGILLVLSMSDYVSRAWSSW